MRPKRHKCKNSKAQSLEDALNEEEKSRPTIDITSKPGTRIRMRYPDNGHLTDQREVALHKLKVNSLYTVKNIRVGGWISYVELEELPGKWFNTVHFAPVRGRRVLCAKHPSNLLKRKKL